MYRTNQKVVSGNDVFGVFDHLGMDPTGDWEVQLVALSSNPFYLVDGLEGTTLGARISSSPEGPTRLVVRNEEVYVKLDYSTPSRISLLAFQT